MDLFGRQVRRSALVNTEGVNFGSVWQGPDTGFGAAFGGVLIAHESGELFIRWVEGVADGGDGGFAQVPAIGLWNGIGKLVERLQIRRLLRRRLADRT